MYVLGGLDDQIPLIVWGQISNFPLSIDNPIFQNFGPHKTAFYGLMHPFETTRPIFAFIVSVLLSIFDSNVLILLNLFSFALLFLFSKVLFSRYKFGIVYALIFTFSSFMWSHLGIHLSLMAVWVIPAFVVLQRKFENDNFSIRNAVTVGIIISIFSLISNYFGFFILIFYFIYTLVSVTFQFRIDKSAAYKNAKFFALSALVSIAITVVILFPSVKEGFFSKAEIRKVGGHYSRARSYEDFFNFSSRPWYYILPPVKNPIFGDFSELVLERIELTNYFLADDYFAAEHQSNYFGTTLLLSAFTIFLYVLRKGNNELRKKVLILGITTFALFLLTFPPFFTVSGITIWTPGVIMHKIFPMFRVTSRLSVVILMCLLLILAIGIDFVYKTAKKDKQYLKYFMIMLLAVTLAEVYVPVKILTIDNPPEIYKYMRNNTPVGSKFAVFPYDKTDDAMLWLPVHERLLINPRGRLEPDFDSREFTENLNSSEGIEGLVELGGDFLVVYHGEDVKEKSEILDFTLVPKITIGNYSLFEL